MYFVCIKFRFNISQHVLFSKKYRYVFGLHKWSKLKEELLDNKSNTTPRLARNLYLMRLIFLFTRLTNKLCPLNGSLHDIIVLWIVKFQTKGCKMRFLAKNQHTQRKLLYFVNWNSGEEAKSAQIEISKIIRIFSNVL